MSLSKCLTSPRPPWSLAVAGSDEILIPSISSVVMVRSSEVRLGWSTQAAVWGVSRLSLCQQVRRRTRIPSQKWKPVLHSGIWFRKDGYCRCASYQTSHRHIAFFFRGSGDDSVGINRSIRHSSELIMIWQKWIASLAAISFFISLNYFKKIIFNFYYIM